MSSLLQFNGQITRKGVHLQFMLVEKYKHDVGGLFEIERERDIDTFVCPTCDKVHPHIHIAIRKPCGMFGCWVVFRYNGEEHVPDLSIPISVTKLPRDAKRLSIEQSARIWHS